MGATPDEHVIAADTGEAIPRYAAHRPGTPESQVLPLAFTSYLEDGQGNVPLLQREENKPFGREWDVGVASHYPADNGHGDTSEERRRTVRARHEEELGIPPVEVRRIATFDYFSWAKGPWVEHERCDVYAGLIDRDVFDPAAVNREEVIDVAWVRRDDLHETLRAEIDRQGDISPYISISPDVKVDESGDIRASDDTLLIPPWATVAALLTTEGADAGDLLGELDTVEDWRYRRE